MAQGKLIREHIQKYAIGNIPKEALAAVAYEVEGEIISNIKASGNIDTGVLINSIQVDLSNVSAGEARVVVGAGGVGYAWFLEEGTGLYGPEHKIITAKHQTKSGRPGFLKFKKPTKGGGSSGGKIPGNAAFEKDGCIFTQQTRGMKPIFFAKRAI